MIESDLDGNNMRDRDQNKMLDLIKCITTIHLEKKVWFNIYLC